jgi:AmmeMemoRadiSam system protein A
MTITELARQAIEHFLQTGQLLEPPAGLPPELKRRAAAFVSLHQPNGDLRGCIGSLTPATDSLADEVIVCATSAATKDPRFSPVTLGELPGLHLSVDVLSPAVPEPDLTRLNPKVYGIIVTAASGRQGVLLPDLEGVNTPAEQISICRQKAGISPNEPVQIAKFKVHRYN